MSKLVLKNGSDNQHLHDQQNEFSGFGKQSMRNSNKVMVHTSNDKASKVTESNFLSNNNNNDMNTDQNDANDSELRQNKEIGKIGSSGISNRNENFQKDDLKQSEISKNLTKLQTKNQNSELKPQSKDSNLDQKQNSSFLQISIDVVSKKLEVHESLNLPELKEDSSNFASKDKKFIEKKVQKNQKTPSEIKQKQENKNKESLKEVHQEKQSSHNEIEEQIKRSRKDSGDGDHSVFHRSENFEVEKQFQNRKRVETECNQRQDEKQLQKKFLNLQMKQNDQGLSVFQTQVFPSNASLLNSKLQKIKQAKQYKKKKLQEELAKVSQQIDSLSKKQAQIKQFGPSYRNFSDRLKINNNNQARQRAISLIKNLQKERKAREINKISSIDKIDVRISDYMSELSKIRTQNEKRLKQKKKLEIIQRMKEKQVKKINEMKKIEASSKFVSQFMSNLQRKPNRQKATSPSQLREVTSPEEQKRRSRVENYDNGMTPELANKKAYLNRVRNLSQKKYKLEYGNERSDPYENKLY